MLITLSTGRDFLKLGLMSTRTAAERSMILFKTALMIFMIIVTAFRLDLVGGSGLNSTDFKKFIPV